jgi:hypothetical protein
MTTKACAALETAYKTLQDELAHGGRHVYRRKVANMTVRKYFGSKNSLML